MDDSNGERWAAWLREQFDTHDAVRKPADLVKRSGAKTNGRPVIDAPRVTAWLRGSRPSYELAVVAAEAFGVPPAQALRAAGYYAGGHVEIQGSVQTSGDPADHVSTGGEHQPDAMDDDELLQRVTTARLLAELQRRVGPESVDGS